MTPVDSLQMLLKVNRPVAIFILAGLGLLAASAVALSWNANHENTLLVACYILGFAFAVTIIVFVCNNHRMRAVLGWTFVGALILFLAGFVDSALALSGRLPVPVCYVRMLWQSRAECEATRIPAEEITARTPLTRSVTSFGGPERLWLAQATDPAPLPAPTGQIFLQHGTGVADADAQGLSDKLTDHGFSVTTRSIVQRDAPTNEVRYYNAEDADRARETAKWLKEQRPDSQILLRDYSGSGVIAGDGVIELWVTE